jgi:hypothetical protein
MLTFRLLNEAGKTPELGEEAFFVADFKNYLWASSSGLKVRLTSKSALLEVLEGESNLGIIEMNQVTTNTANPFRVKVFENTPANVKIDLLLEFEDGEYYDYQFVSILLNPTFLNIEENLVTSSIAENGRLGYQDTEQSEGQGFVFDEQNLLYEMGLMLGNSEEQTSTTVRKNTTTHDDDFVSTQRIRSISPGDYSAVEILGQFNDSSALESASNVLVDYRTMAWKEDPDDQYFIIEYSIKNEGDSTLNSFYTGLYADWDISQDGTDIGREDRADWDTNTSMGYVYNTDSTDQAYAGIQVLTGSANYWAIDNDNTVTDNPWGVYDGFKDEEKYESMSSGIGRQQAGFSDPAGQDVSHTVSAGPFVIEPGDSIIVAFAIHGASTLNDLLESAKAADTMYNYTLKEAMPVVPGMDICYEDSAVLTATGATSYKWYKTKTGGTSFFDGDVYTTINLFDDTVFYVSNAENAWESVRTPVAVSVKANPTIILSGSQFICDGDTTTLMVAESDSYLWNPGGEETQSIEINESGMFNVTVTYDALGCISTSQNIEIVKNESPSASFQIDKSEIDKNEDVEINLTDLSDQASDWFWRLSDGQTSTEQNPVFTVNTIDPIEVILTATSNNGCQDQDIQTIDVITSLDDETPLSESLKFYPNPTSGEIKIELVNEYTGKYEIMIFNTMGKMVRHYRFNKDGEFAQGIIDLNGLSKGMYMLHIDQKPIGRTTSKILLK